MRTVSGCPGPSFEGQGTSGTTGVRHLAAVVASVSLLLLAIPMRRDVPAARPHSPACSTPLCSWMVGDCLAYCCTAVVGWT